MQRGRSEHRMWSQRFWSSLCGHYIETHVKRMDSIQKQWRRCWPSYVIIFSIAYGWFSSARHWSLGYNEFTSKEPRYYVKYSSYLEISKHRPAIISRCCIPEFSISNFKKSANTSDLSLAIIKFTSDLEQSDIPTSTVKPLVQQRVVVTTTTSSHGKMCSAGHWTHVV